MHDARHAAQAGIARRTQPVETGNHAITAAFGTHQQRFEYTQPANRRFQILEVAWIVVLPGLSDVNGWQESSSSG